MLAGAAVSWVSKRQPTVALSTAEAEYTTACLAAQAYHCGRRLTIRDTHVQQPDRRPSEAHRHKDALREGGSREGSRKLQVHPNIRRSRRRIDEGAERAEDSQVPKHNSRGHRNGDD